MHAFMKLTTHRGQEAWFRVDSIIGVVKGENQTELQSASGAVALVKEDLEYIFTGLDEAYREMS